VTNRTSSPRVNLPELVGERGRFLFGGGTQWGKRQVGNGRWAPVHLRMKAASNPHHGREGPAIE